MIRKFGCVLAFAVRGLAWIGSVALVQSACKMEQCGKLPSSQRQRLNGREEPTLLRRSNQVTGGRLDLPQAAPQLSSFKALVLDRS
jgi:hypothetical protein